MSDLLEEYEFLHEQNLILREGTDAAFIKAANNFLKARDLKLRYQTGQGVQARVFIEGVAKDFGFSKHYLKAATLLFGREHIDARPQSARDIERVFVEHNLIGIPGASSLGKSHVLGIILVVDYWLDPEGTRVRVASVSKDHLAGQLFSSMIRAVENSVIDMGLECSVNSAWIRRRGMETLDYVIRGQAFKQGDSNPSGRFKGVKAEPRTGSREQQEMKKRLGNMTRVRILLDEAAQIPAGVFKDLDSPLASAGNGVDRVKCMFAFNPDDITHISAKYCEPIEGFDSLDPEVDHEWDSRLGYHVLRLDAAMTENVKRREELYPGLHSYENFMRLQSQGAESSEYWVYGRGFWPRRGATFTIIPMGNIIKQRGELIFPQKPKRGGAIDLAFVQDQCIFTSFKYGMASGVLLPNGTQETFRMDGQPAMRPCIQIEQQFPIVMKTNTLELVEEIISLCRTLEITPEWLVLDRTAIGKGAYDLLCAKFGEVLGINWQEGATPSKVLADDIDNASERYVSISAEMWFTTAKWLEHGFLWISEEVPTNPLFYQLSTRRYMKGRGGRLKVEEKDVYAKRENSGKSPDEGDSLVMAPILCRMRGDWLPSASGKEVTNDSAAGPSIDWDSLYDNMDTGDNLITAIEED